MLHSLRMLAMLPTVLGLTAAFNAPGNLVHQLHKGCISDDASMMRLVGCGPYNQMALGKIVNRALIVMGKRAKGSKAGASQVDEARRALAREARPVPLKVLTVGKAADAAAEAYCKTWADKVRRYAPLQEVLVRSNPKKASEPAAQMSAEGERASKQVGKGERLVLLDERGREMSSEAFADLIASTGDEGYTGLVFAVGGPFGHGPQMRERANDVIRLSRCVLNHQVARMVLLEQLYRAWTILRGEPYHH